MNALRKARTDVLEIGYEETGVPTGTPVVLLHGFPYDVRAYDDVVARLVSTGARILVPYLRAYGPTHFLCESTLRSGQQGALGADLLAFLDALQIERAVLAGYDWGGRAACIVAALHPQRCVGLVSCGGYNVNDIPASSNPAAPPNEHAIWYQFYFHGERGRRALLERRDELTRYLWQTWSPTWHFDDATFERTASSFKTPDFVETVVHSYRHRYGLVAGDPAYDAIEAALEAKPTIDVPSIVLDGLASSFNAASPPKDPAPHFGGPFERRGLPMIGHNVPQEAPEAFASAVGALLGAVRV